MSIKNNIIKAEDLPEKENIYLKKDMFGYRIVHPVKNEDGTINYLNLLFGGKRNLINLIIILLVMGLLIYSYQHDIKSMKGVVANPCNYCVDCFSVQKDDYFLNVSLPEIQGAEDV